jgi:hypothetical protein
VWSAVEVQGLDPLVQGLCRARVGKPKGAHVWSSAFTPCFRMRFASDVQTTIVARNARDYLWIMVGGRVHSYPFSYHFVDQPPISYILGRVHSYPFTYHFVYPQPISYIKNLFLASPNRFGIRSKACVLATTC